MALLQIRVDEDLKNQANAVFQALGLDLSTAVRMFLQKSVQEGGLPFSTLLDRKTLEAIKTLRVVQERNEKNGNSEMTLDEINEVIKRAREERKAKKPL